MRAAAHPKTKRFMRELMRLCKKHKLCIVPTFQGSVSFHDSMMVIPLDIPATDFIWIYTQTEEV